MFKLIILLSMIFCHLVDDYYLQGILASMKQKKWWEENAPKKMYKYDYICALIEHAFSWTFMMTFPITICIVLGKIEVNGVLFALLFCLNWVVHTFIDNLKANKLKINLCTDQFAHLIQIVVTWLLLVVI